VIGSSTSSVESALTPSPPIEPRPTTADSSAPKPYQLDMLRKFLPATAAVAIISGVGILGMLKLKEPQKDEAKVSAQTDKMQSKTYSAATPKLNPQRAELILAKKLTGSWRDKEIGDCATPLNIAADEANSALAISIDGKTEIVKWKAVSNDWLTLADYTSFRSSLTDVNILEIRTEDNNVRPYTRCPIALDMK
jgi:hypothetical protein